jgi:LPXTG-motif cell wall-anchored protein
MNRIRAIIAASALALGAGLALAAPAQAATDQPGPACGTWKFSQAVLPYPAPLVPGAGLSSTDGSTATLKKPDNAEPDSAAGVEFAAKDLEIDGPTVITVKVSTDVANLASGAVRFFGYEDQNANTLTDGPDYQATADADGQTLTLNVTGPVGTLGLVYDASNATTGTVTFSDLKVGDLAGKFKACPKPQESPTATPPATRPPTSPPAATGPQPTLPKTGPKVAVLTAIGGAVLLAGAALVVGARRRRRPRFEA